MRTRGRQHFLKRWAGGAIGGAALVAVPLPAARPSFAVPPSSIATALATLARQSDADIGGSDPALAAVATRGVAGTMRIGRALATLLRGTPFTYRPLGPKTFRIVRRAAPPLARVVAPAPPPARADEIVVTGSKREVTLAAYPGSAQIIPIDQGAAGPIGGGGQDWLLARSAILQSTELGPGRNKLFIRGVADSSFTGPTQATAGTYFGDVRTGYNGPDPNLNLYDVERIEVLEGPQGALYGAGSIGGIIRLTPHPADLEGFEASSNFGASVTAHGAPGYDAAAMLNLVPLAGRVAIRAVGYRSVDGGYIDDKARGRSNVNRLSVTGGRVAARVRPFDGWTIDGGFLIQSSRQPDLQYAAQSAPALTRRSAIAQPFEDDYRLLRGVIGKAWGGGLAFTATAGRVAHDTDQRYDATRPGMAVPLAYDERNHIRFTSFEGRLSRTAKGDVGWLVGVSRISDYTATSRTFGPLDATRDLVGVTNRTQELAGYGELTLPVGARFALTGGVRYTRARMDGEPSISPVNRDFIRGQTSRRFDPQAGFSWKVAPAIVWFGQFQQGFRTGGLAVARGVGRVATYSPDQIRVGETGVRLLRTGARGLSAVLAVSLTRWDDIQADLVSRGGFPYTANVGSGRIVAVEGNVDWLFNPSLRATAAFFVNHSSLDDPAPDYVSSGARPLPATPAVTTTAQIAWTRPFVAGSVLKLNANARYVSHARLGVGPVLDIRYGNYVTTGLTAALAWRAVEASLGVQNLLDTRGNRFAIGNPFGIAFRDEVTPLRPRTIRLGLATRF